MYSREEAKRLRIDFWETFGKYVEFFGRKKQEKIKWLLHKTGIKDIDLKFDIDSKYIIVAIEVNASAEDRRFDLFVELNNFKKILNSNLSDELIWQEEYTLRNGKKVSRVYVKTEEYNFHNRDHWPQVYAFMAENMFALQNNLMDIKPILKDRI